MRAVMVCGTAASVVGKATFQTPSEPATAVTAAVPTPVASMVAAAGANPQMVARAGARCKSERCWGYSITPAVPQVL